MQQQNSIKTTATSSVGKALRIKMKKGFTGFRKDTLKTAVQTTCHGHKQKSSQNQPQRKSSCPHTQKEKRGGKHPLTYYPCHQTVQQDYSWWVFQHSLPRLQILPSECSSEWKETRNPDCNNSQALLSLCQSQHLIYLSS